MHITSTCVLYCIVLYCIVLYCAARLAGWHDVSKQESTQRVVLRYCCLILPCLEWKILWVFYFFYGSVILSPGGSVVVLAHSVLSWPQAPTCMSLLNIMPCMIWSFFFCFLWEGWVFSFVTHSMWCMPFCTEVFIIIFECYLYVRGITLRSPANSHAEFGLDFGVFSFFYCNSSLRG